MASPWINVAPESLYWAIRNPSDIWKAKEFYITENGCSSDDVINAAGHIEDTDRVMYLRNHVTQMHRAAAEGYPIKGYFLWSLLDNFEWADGYSKRFGICYVDFKTQKRTLKQSAEWYREVIKRNAVVYVARCNRRATPFTATRFVASNRDEHSRSRPRRRRRSRVSGRPRRHDRFQNARHFVHAPVARRRQRRARPVKLSARQRLVSWTRFHI